MGSNLETALELVGRWSERIPGEEPEPTARGSEQQPPPQPSKRELTEEEMVAQNNAALARIAAMMPGGIRV